MSGLRVGIVGCGLIGHKRAAAIGAGDRVVAVHDVAPAAAAALAAETGATVCAGLDELLEHRPDVVLIATTHDQLAALACAALRVSDVLLEKPGGISSDEIERVAAAAARHGRIAKVGFNHRFHPGLARAIAEARSGEHGDVMHLRARYGHGGRVGYDREWRTDRAQSGGGELVDQGMHLLDLTNAVLGELPVHSALVRTHFWDTDVEDNAVLILGDHAGRAAPWALLHVTWTEWKNLFSLEIYCRTAKLQVDGLVGSYGPQTLRIHRMRPELGPPDTEVIDCPPEDGSWRAEWENLRAAITARDPGLLQGDLAGAAYAWRCIEAAYAA